MTDEAKALVERLRDDLPQTLIEKHWVDDHDAICKQREEAADLIETQARALEQHEAFRQEVSEAVKNYYGDYPWDSMHPALSRFIIPKPDPVKMLFDYLETTENYYPPEFEGDIRAALAARGLEVRKIGEGE